MAMDFDVYMRNAAGEIDGEITKVLASFRGEVSETDKNLLPLVDKFILSCEGGKRIRGVMVLLGYEIARGKGRGERGKSEKEIFRAAAAFEIFQTAILAHDDIIDQSPTRRGRPSLYKSAGKDKALVLADIGFFLANTLIDNPKAQKFFNRAMINTGLGQLLDLEPQKKKPQIIQTYELKTAWYTFIGPLTLGAILGGADGKMIKRLELFGKNLGIAYQIRDDILDGENSLGNSDFCQKKVLEYALAAKKMIRDITSDESTRKLLEEMVEYLVRRTK